jgi:hypothetical protein
LGLLRIVPPAIGWAGFFIAISAFFVPGLIRRYRHCIPAVPKNSDDNGNVNSDSSG